MTEMKKSTISKLRKIRNKILWEKFFFNRGKSIISDLIELLTLTTVVGLFVNLINNNFHTNFNAGKAMLFIPLVMVIYWIIGRIDFKKIHLIQKENEIQMEANPALYDKIKNIEKKLNNKIKNNIKT